ncbi:hypothetical protein AR546_07890 [Leptospira interrogans serovar Canicola]|nr:hypothetical protein B2G47_12990 [Leptospira interrogans serovar Canicola]OLZ31986.1 hypothetical protein AR546_07890 [Leptospira interrogans serovar Canicola]POR18728.1 hypothetical protein B0T34_08380 [Leptospira interrogans serovar Canicola]
MDKRKHFLEVCMKDHKMKIAIILAVFFLFLMIMLRFLHFIPTWNKFYIWINYLLFLISIILLLYIIFQIGKVFWKLSKWLTICLIIPLIMPVLFYFSFIFIVNHLAGNEDPRCNIDKITEYPIGEYPKTLFVIYYNCTPDLVFKVRKGWLPIWENVNFVESDSEHSQIIEISDQYGNRYGYDPIQNNFWHILK